MAYPAGQYYMDGKDLFLVYGLVIAVGIDDLLKMPDRKDSITHDWLDENGLDTDLSRVFFESREVTLQCSIHASSVEDFRNKYNGFIAMMAQPGLRRLEVTSLGSSYYVFYKSNPSFVRVSKFANSLNGGHIACKLTLTVVEKAPTIDSSNVYLITDDNRFLIT